MAGTIAASPKGYCSYLHTGTRKPGNGRDVGFYAEMTRD